MEESLIKSLITNFDIKFFFSHLTDYLQSIFYFAICAALTLTLLFYTLKPILAFFIKPLLNKKQKRLDRIINDEKLENDSIKKTCKKEKEILYIQDITKCRNRQLALFFYGLTKLTKNKISPTHFERFYGYLYITDKDIQISNRKIFIDNIVYVFLAFFLICSAPFLSYSFYISTLPFYSIIILIIALCDCYILTLYLFSRIIRRREKEEFLKVKNAFLEKLLPELKP